MSPKEAKRVYILEKLEEGKLNVPEAAQHLGLSVRQVFRLKGGVQKHGIGALAHKNRGKTPKHATSQALKEQVITLAIDDYHEASYAHMANLLAQHQQIHLSAKTVGRILKQAGLSPARSRKPPRRHRSRDRRAQEGLLVQIDASPHDWLEGRGPRMSLHGAIDDATSKVLGLYFRPTEDAVGYFQVLQQVITQQGLPRSLYSDRHTIFLSPQSEKLTLTEELAGQTVPLTQVGRALQQLGIQHIGARSPQAKGRIERLWGTLQQRLVVEMRLAGITTIEQANAFLTEFRMQFNQRFAVEPLDPQPAYALPTPDQDLGTILCFRHERKASRGSTISFQGQSYQLQDPRGQGVPLTPKRTVWVLEQLDGSFSALYEDRRYRLKEFTYIPTAQPVELTPKPPRAPYRPPADHPWRRMSIRTPSPGAGVAYG